MRQTVGRTAAFFAVAALVFAGPALAQQSVEASGGGGKKESEKAVPKAEQSVTHHSVVIGGVTVRYTATAGTLILRDREDKPEASVGYVAYTRDGAKDPSARPITFAYNGGPGSSSLWLHMGALGPRRVKTTDAGPTPPPPYDLVDNEFSLIDVTDLVMIDPVGTGLSRAVGKKKDADFWGVDPDIESVSRFIEQYVDANNRWNSPKYLLGESYGTTRSAGVVDYLQSREGMSFNGVILVSVALDLEAIFNWPGNDRPYALFLPTYAAVAWYHDALPDKPARLEPWLDEVRAYALGPYTHALMKGDDLSEQERTAVAEKLHQYTGLSVDYLRKANLRVTEGQFTQELLREHGETVGRLDARFTGVSFDRLAEHAEYDPQSAAISPAFTAAFMRYLHQELQFGKGKTYNVSARVFGQWKWEHRAPGGGFPAPFPNTGLDLAHAMGYNPNLRVLVLNGYYDLATPFLATEYMISHLALSEELRPHVEMKYYEAGHMMYIHPPSLEKFKADVAEFISRTDRVEGGRPLKG
ncbi:MAG: S10 family peptidase [Gemmatimonadota bacterium]